MIGTERDAFHRKLIIVANECEVISMKCFTLAGREVPQALLREAVQDPGLVLLRDVDMDEIHLASTCLGHILEHPDSDATGITTIQPRRLRTPNDRAFTRNGLSPHTDGTAVPDPADVLILHCAQAAPDGGGATFVDGLPMFRRMLQQFERTKLTSLRLQHRDRGDLGAVFTFDCHNELGSLRYRDDDLAWPVSGVPGIVTALRDNIADSTVHRPLSSGEGYMINNNRWLHGRTAFSGDRVVLRLSLRLAPRTDAPARPPQRGGNG